MSRCGRLTTHIIAPMRQQPSCYVCGTPAETREHIPPKSFFPRGKGLSLTTVPSCVVHNNSKSDDDQYLLAHISLHSARLDNLPAQIFRRSIVPQLERRPAFARLLTDASITLPDGTRQYQVDVKRFDAFFDHLTKGLFYVRYGARFDPSLHRMGHVYLDLASEDENAERLRCSSATMLGHFLPAFKDAVSTHVSDYVDEQVYMHRVIDPAGKDASITIIHTFYGLFDVVTYLTDAKR